MQRARTRGEAELDEVMARDGTRVHGKVVGEHRLQLTLASIVHHADAQKPTGNFIFAQFSTDKS